MPHALICNNTHTHIVFDSKYPHPPQMLCIFPVRDSLSRCPMWIFFVSEAKFGFFVISGRDVKRVHHCVPFCDEALVSRRHGGVWGCVGWILHSAAKATALKTSGCSSGLVPGALRKQKTLPYSHLWRYTCAFYSFSSAIILSSSRKRKMQVNIPAVTAEVRAWCQITPPLLSFYDPHHSHSGKRIRVSPGFHVQRIIQLGIIFLYITLPYININCLE